MHVLSGAGVGMQDTLRCAVIGSGFAGSTFAEAIRYVPEAQLVVIAGGHQAANLAARHGVPALPTAEVDPVLESDEIDAVIIASPNPMHAPQAIRAAQAGKHILIEKPMGMTVAECQAMIAAARAAGVTLMPGGHMHRYRRTETAVKFMLQRGTIGHVDMASITLTEPDETTWLNTPANGGYLLGSGVHCIDQAIQTHGGNGFALEYGLTDMYWGIRLVRTAPVSREMILNYIAEHSLGLPRSY